MSTVPVQFKTVYPGAGKEPYDMVLLAPRGDAFEKQQTWHRINSIRPPEHPSDTLRDSDSYQTMMARWAIIEPAYRAWKDGNEIPEDGTPLEAWSGVSKEQIEFLRKMGIRTVEHVRDMDDAAIASLPFPKARQLPGLAREYLEGSDLAAKDAELAQMRERMAAMEALLEETTKAPAKRGPGRPKKQEADAA